MLTGSAMRVLRGFALTPADLDLEVGVDDAQRAADVLGLPAPARRSDDAVSSLRSIGRLGGVEVDLTADLVIEGPGGRLAPDFEGQRTLGTTILVGDRRVPLAPIEELVARAEVRDPGRGRQRLLRGSPPGLKVDEAWIGRRRAPGRFD